MMMRWKRQKQEGGKTKLCFPLPAFYFHQVDINTITRLTDELGNLSALQRLEQK